MGIARKLVLLALTVVAVMALNVSAASAIEVTEEPPMGATNGPHCNVTVTEEVASMCSLNGTSVGTLELGGPLGIMVTCNVTLTAVISEAAVVSIPSYNVDEAGCSGGLAHECITAGHRHPNASPTGSPAAFPIPIEYDYCLDHESPINLGDIECHLSGTLNRTGAAPSHQYELAFTHAGSKCEQNNSFSLNGIIRTATESGIEIIP